MPDLSVIVVSWNVRSLLHACLTSIQSSPVALMGDTTRRGEPDALEVETILVDSASSDGTPDMIRAEFPWVRLIEPGENVGFSKGNNLGMEASRGKAVLLLNPDTEIVGDALPRMAAYLDAHPEVGVLGPQLLNADGTIQSSRRRFPTAWTAFFEATWLEPVAPRAILRHFKMLDCPDDQTLPVDWVTGAAMFARREAIEQVGEMDTGYFMYSEELDWQRRIKGAGWQIVYFPAAKVIHHGGKSSEQVAAQRDINFHTSKIRYYRLYHGPLLAVSLRAFLLVGYAGRLILEGAKWLVGHKRTMRKERVHAYWQVIRSGLREG
jgi:N-acetylglucosaminyl-diphospho-decaprenol L-rhamnosyltransferase